MNIKQQKLAIGCLLHDFGKLLYRYNDGRNHSTSGYDYMKELSALENEGEILDSIRYHHGALLKDASVKDDALCYITYIADNIASAADRRSKESGEGGFVRDIPFESIFNILNGNNENLVYSPGVLGEDSSINYPTNNGKPYSEEFYSKIISNIRDAISGIRFEDAYINSLLQILESNLTFIPSSTQTAELRDISLYDHLKLTAAFGLCIEQYLTENNIGDYKSELFKNAKEFYDKKVFRIYSFDISGIQEFIYNISSKSALKGLRARSFYLEIFMESVIDELLARSDLCRANVMYTGGGHAYIIMPATQKAQTVTENFENELNAWVLEKFGSALYIASGFADCSSNELQNLPQGSYKEIFSQISQRISAKKLHRYSVADILRLNAPKDLDYKRECSICHRSDMLHKDNECSVCSGLKSLADMIIDKKDMFFTVVKDIEPEKSVILPFNCVLTAFTETELKDFMKNNEENYVRAYSKNKPYTGYNISSNLWVGDYASHKEFSRLAQNSRGIKRLAVIRADVDNLGQAFVNGFNREDNGGKYETVTRTSVFSRKLSTFFKLHINKLLSEGEFQLFEENTGKRNAVIVYSGGDDLFIAGSWDDIVCFAVDLYNSLKKYSQGRLTISAGIGIYPEKFPIYAMASQSGELEDAAKSYDNESKNSVALFSEENVYHWNELIEDVIGEKLRLLQEFIENDGNHAKAMLYKMLELIRNRQKDNKLNIARFTYLIARLKPQKKKGDDEKAYEEKLKNYNRFGSKMFEWIQNEKHCRQLITAIYIYVYMNREREDKNE